MICFFAAIALSLTRRRSKFFQFQENCSKSGALISLLTFPWSVPFSVIVSLCVCVFLFSLSCSEFMNSKPRFLRLKFVSKPSAIRERLGVERTLHLEYSTRSSWAELRMLEQFTRLFIMLASVKAGCEACWGIKHEQCLPLFMWFPELKNLVVKSFRQFIRESSSCCVGNWGERGVENTIYRRV